MAITINTNYKIGTLGSVSGTTFVSSGTEFESGDVGRFIRFRDGTAIGQIRKIIGFTNTSTITVDAPWDESPIEEFTDTLPTAGNTWHMSLTLDDIDDGTHLIKDSAGNYRQNEAAGTITLNAVFVADTKKNIQLNTHLFVLSTTAAFQLGYMHPSGYGMDGCSLIDTMPDATSKGGWAGTSSNGISGDLHIYGCTVSCNTTGNPFWRCYRGSDHIVRLVDSIFSGNYAGRLQGTKSAMLRVNLRGNNSLSTIAGIGVITPFGLVSGTTVEASAQAAYTLPNLGVGTITSARFRDISTRIISTSNISPHTANTLVVQDYVESDLTSAPVLITCSRTRSETIFSFRQYIDTSVVDSTLAPVTEPLKRVIKDGSATIVDTQTITTGVFDRYIAEVKRFTGITGNQYFSGGTSYGPYTLAIGSYNYQLINLNMPLARSNNTEFTALLDTSISETDKTVVDAYTTLDTARQVYDRAKSHLYNNYTGETATIVSRVGSQLDLATKDLVIDATAVAVFANGGNTVTIKSSSFAAGATATTGTVTTTNGALLDGGTFDCDIVYDSGDSTTITDITCSGAIDFTTAGTYTIDGCDLSEVTNSSGGSVILTLVNGASVTTNTGPDITINDVKSFSVTGIDATDAVTRIQIYNLTTDTECCNSDITGQSSYSGSYNEGEDFTTGDSVRIRITANNGTTAKKEYETTVDVSSVGWSTLVSQEECLVYNTLAIDGSAVTGFAADYIDDEIDIIVASNFYISNLYAWWKYNLTTENGIRQFFGGLIAVDIGNFEIIDSIISIKLDNTTSSEVWALDNRRLFRDDGTRPVKNPTTGGGGIDVEWREKVLLAESGVSGLTTQESEDLTSIKKKVSSVLSLTTANFVK